MSDATNPTTIPILGGNVREVQGLLPDEGTLQQATQALLTGGFDRGDLSLPEADLPPSEPTQTQTTGSVVDEHDARQLRTAVNSTAGVAAALIGGTVASVATGGAMLPVAVGAVAAAVGGGGLAHLGLQGAADSREAAHDAKGASGKLILAAIVRDPERERAATEILRREGATEVRTVERSGAEMRSV